MPIQATPSHPPRRDIDASVTVHRTRWGSIVQTVVFDTAKPEPSVSYIVFASDTAPKTVAGVVAGEFARIHRYCRSEQVYGQVYIGAKCARDGLLVEADRFPWVEIVDGIREPHRSLVFRRSDDFGRIVAALRRLGTPDLHRVEASVSGTALALMERTVVATDGSAGSWRHKGIGWAAVAADGRYAFGKTSATNDAHVAELRGVKLALDTFPGPLDICTDSKAVVTWVVHGDDAGNQTRRNLVHSIRQKMDECESGLTWVKGHSGHMLNEKADRLARVARLDLQDFYAGKADEVAQRIIAGSMEDLQKDK